MYQLKPLPPTTIRPARGPDIHRQKWLVVNDVGEPVTTKANRQLSYTYTPHPDERAMLKELQREFPEYLVVNCPDPQAFPEMRARFEVRIETKATPKQLEAIEEAPVVVTQGQIF